MSLVIPGRAALLLDSPVYGDGGGRGRGLDASEGGGVDGNEVGGESSEGSSIGLDEDDGSSFLSTSTSKTEEDEVQSGLGVVNPLESLDSLDDALPIKRGLSTFFNGKSKSFQCLSEAAAPDATASVLAKKENPFNKRRRILMASKSSWRRRASCTSLFNAPSLPVLHSLEENDREEEQAAESEEEEKGGDEEKHKQGNADEKDVGKALLLGHRPLPPAGRRVKTFRSPRCFSLGDLQRNSVRSKLI